MFGFRVSFDSFHTQMKIKTAAKASGYHYNRFEFASSIWRHAIFFLPFLMLRLNLHTHFFSPLNFSLQLYSNERKTLDIVGYVFYF